MGIGSDFWLPGERVIFSLVVGLLPGYVLTITVSVKMTANDIMWLNEYNHSYLFIVCDRKQLCRNDRFLTNMSFKFVRFFFKQNLEGKKKMRSFSVEVG